MDRILTSNLLTFFEHLSAQFSSVYLTSAYSLWIAFIIPWLGYALFTIHTDYRTALRESRRTRDRGSFGWRESTHSDVVAVRSSLSDIGWVSRAAFFFCVLCFCPKRIYCAVWWFKVLLSVLSRWLSLTDVCRPPRILLNRRISNTNIVFWRRQHISYTICLSRRWWSMYVYVFVINRCQRAMALQKHNIGYT